jgi:SAM-dependent methyltransferase
VIAELYKVIRQPRRAARFVSSYLQGRLFWESRFDQVREPKVRGAVPHEAATQRALANQLRDAGFDVSEMALDLDDYRRFLVRARYDRFPTYYAGGQDEGFHEKALEHYLAARLMGLDPGDTYVDVASFDSPTPRIYRDLFGCDTYRQDLVYPPGRTGDQIGGDAAHMPVPDEFATRMALHNAFEHFEGESDIGFIHEAARVLRPGGKLCIVPLLLFDRYAIQTDPAVFPRGGISFERDATVYGARGWRDRHGRFYDVASLGARIREQLGCLRLRIVVVGNEHDVHPSCYVKFVALIEKPAA